MKKYLLPLFVMVILAAAFTSCKPDEEIYNPNCKISKIWYRSNSDWDHPNERYVYDSKDKLLQEIIVDSVYSFKFTYNKDNTVIVDGLGAKDEIAARVSQIRAQIAETKSDFDREKLQERLAKLAGGVAVIRVGAPTETEMKDKKFRMEDALNATRAAVEEGIIAGGGTAYIHAADELNELIAGLEGDEKTGAQIIQRALSAPLYRIAENAGEEGAVIVNKVRDAQVGIGYNALTGEYVDMVESGILDPVKVTRSALENANSVAATLLTTESAVSQIKEPQPPMPAGNPGMGMM